MEQFLLVVPGDALYIIGDRHSSSTPWHPEGLAKFLNDGWVIKQISAAGISGSESYSGYSECFVLLEREKKEE